LVKKHRSSKI